MMPEIKRPYRVDVMRDGDWRYVSAYTYLGGAIRELLSEEGFQFHMKGNHEKAYIWKVSDRRTEQIMAGQGCWPTKIGWYQGTLKTDGRVAALYLNEWGWSPFCDTIGVDSLEEGFDINYPVLPLLAATEL